MAGRRDVPSRAGDGAREGRPGILFNEGSAAVAPMRQAVAAFPAPAAHDATPGGRMPGINRQGRRAIWTLPSPTYERPWTPPPACGATAVEISAGRPEEAPVRLEQGRGVLLAQVLRLRGRHHEPAGRFERVHAELIEERGIAGNALP